MTKAQLLEALKNWPDDAQIEVSIPADIDDPTNDRVWFEIRDVEKFKNSLKNKGFDEHCLLYAGKITME